MTIFMLGGLAVLAVLVLLLFGALVELQRQLVQLRQLSGLVDDTRPLKFNEAAVLSELRIPAASLLAGDARSALLVLSDGCSTCSEIAQHFASAPDVNIMAVVQSRSAEDAAYWLGGHGLEPGPWIVYDEGGRIATHLGVTVTPAVVKFEGEFPIGATTVPSTRQLDRVVDWASAAGARRKTGVEQ